MASKNSTGFTDAEKKAMQDRAEELRAEKGGAKKADLEKAALDAIAEMNDSDRAIIERVHALALRHAPDLRLKLWYGMPAWARDKDIIFFVQQAEKFEARYATFGFNPPANLDDGDMWPTSFAVKRITPAVEKTMAGLIQRAVG